MKKFIPFILLMFLNISIFAQAEKPTVAILPFSNSSGAPSKYADMLQQKVQEAFIDEGRLDIIEKERMTSILEQNDIQYDPESSFDPSSMPEQALKGIQYFVVGKITSITVDDVKGSDGSISYTANIKYSLRVVETGTGKLVKEESFSPSGTAGLIASSTPDKAVMNTMTWVKKSTKKYISRAFPVKDLTIMEITEQGKGKAKKVLLEAGESLGLKKGMTLIVYENIVSSNGKMRKKEVGALTILEVEGDDFSECKVTKGGDIIAQKSDEGDLESLSCETKEKKSIKIPGFGK